MQNLFQYECERCGTLLISDKPKEYSIWYNSVLKKMFCSGCSEIAGGTFQRIYTGAFLDGVPQYRLKLPVHPHLEPRFTFKD